MSLFNVGIFFWRPYGSAADFLLAQKTNGPAYVLLQSLISWIWGFKNVSSIISDYEATLWDAKVKYVV